MDFESTADYQAFLGRIAAEESLARYHLMEVTPNAPEFLYFLNLRLRSYRGDESIDPGESAPLEEVVPDADGTPTRWSELFEGSYRGALVLLNLLVHEEDPQDPVGGPESDATSEELFDRYKQKALRVLGKMGAQISAAGTVEGVVVGPETPQLRRIRLRLLSHSRRLRGRLHGERTGRRAGEPACGPEHGLGRVLGQALRGVRTGGAVGFRAGYPCRRTRRPSSADPSSSAAPASGTTWMEMPPIWMV